MRRRHPKGGRDVREALDAVVVRALEPVDGGQLLGQRRPLEHARRVVVVVAACQAVVANGWAPTARTLWAGTLGCGRNGSRFG